MNFPEQEEFTVEDVAARWGKSVSYVQDLTRRRLLPMRNRISSVENWRVRFKSFITLADLETFEKNAGVSNGSWKHLKEAAQILDISVKTLRRRLKEGKFKKGLDGKRIIVFIPSKS
jgi:hypothetical protein